MSFHDDSSSVAKQHICFYGSGSMAEAIVRGILNQELVPSKQIAMLNRSNKERQQELHMQYGVQTAMQGKTNEQYLQEADIIFLAMKPKDAAKALRSLQPMLRPSQLIISVIAGLSIHAMQQLLGNDIPIVRTMPNTSSTIGLGVTGISYSSTVNEQQRFMTETMFDSTGVYTVIEESMQDSITSITGSGPAYIYYIMEIMMKGAQQAGFTEEQASQLVTQTVLGAATMVQQTQESPANLRRKVSSPNGTTQAAIETMAANGLEQALLSGISRCAERAAEIGRAIEEDI